MLTAKDTLYDLKTYNDDLFHILNSTAQHTFGTIKSSQTLSTMIMDYQRKLELAGFQVSKLGTHRILAVKNAITITILDLIFEKASGGGDIVHYSLEKAS